MDGIEPYVRGKNDHTRGVLRRENPYDLDMYGTTQWESWFEGWDEAEAERRSAMEAPNPPPS